MIRKYKDKGMFEPNQFSFNTRLNPIGKGINLPSTINKPQANLNLPQTPTLNSNMGSRVGLRVPTTQTDLQYKKPGTTQPGLTFSSILQNNNSSNTMSLGTNGIVNQSDVYDKKTASGLNFGEKTATGLPFNNQQKTAGGQTTMPLTASGGNGGDYEEEPFEMQSFDDFTKGIKGSGIYADEALQMGLPYLFRLFNKPPVAKFKRTQDVINPATGLPYETIQQAKGNIQRGLVAATRNKSTDLMTNAAMAAMAAANAAQQQNDIDVKNAGQYIGERKSVGQAIIKNKDANDDFYNRNEAMRVESITNQQNSDKLQAKETAGQIGQIAAQNRAEKNMKMQAAQPFYQQQMQAKFDKEHGETKAAGIDAANKMNEAKSLIAEFDKLDADPKTDKQSASYLEAQRKAATAKTDLETNKTTWLQSINKLKGLQEEFNLELSKQGMSQLKKSKGGLIFKKGGSLSVSDRKELKEHEFALKERLESAKQRAKEANERYKELKKQELEFRKSLTKSSMEGYKIIDNFYKKYKK